MLEIPLENLMVKWSDAIGAGSFGRVFRGTWMGTDVAVKQIRRGASAKESVPREAQSTACCSTPTLSVSLVFLQKRRIFSS